MGILFALLAVVCYLAFFIDWKELLDAAGLGGWVYVATFFALAVLITIIVSTPETAAVAPSVHH